MAYPVPTNSPQITVAGTHYAVAAFDWANIVGTFYKVGVFQLMPDGTWNQVGTDAALYANSGDCLSDIQAKGGTVKYLAWLVSKVNAVLAQIFAVAPPAPTGEPTTEDAARAWLTGAVPTLKLTLVNGVPVLG